MFKRLFWFSAGAAAGVAGLRRFEREIAERRARLEPDALVNTAAEAAGRSADRVRSAFVDGRREMTRVTQELEATHDPSRRPARDAHRSGPSRTGPSQTGSAPTERGRTTRPSPATASDGPGG